MISLCRFKEIYHDENMPSIFQSVSQNSIPEKDKIVRYMKSFKPNSAAPGSAIDVFTGERISVPLTCSDDGKYIWRSDILYYFEKYNLKLLDEFVDYVTAKV